MNIAKTRMKILWILLIGANLVQCRTRNSTTAATQARIDKKNPEISADASDKKTISTLELIQKNKPVRGDVIIIWDKVDTDASKELGLDFIPDVVPVGAVVRQEPPIPHNPPVNYADDAARDMSDDITIDVSPGDIKRLCTIGKAVKDLCAGILPSPLNVINQMGKDQLTSWKPASEFDSPIPKFEAGDDLNYPLNSHLIFDTNNTIEQLPMQIRLNPGAEQHIPMLITEIHLLRLPGENRPYLSTLGDQEADVVAKVIDLSAIGIAHVLDHTGKRIGTVRASWSSYYSSYGDVATILNAEGKTIAMVEIKTTIPQVSYYSVNSNGGKGSVFAQSTFANSGQKTHFSKAQPDDLDSRIAAILPAMVNRWFGGKLGSL